MSKELKNCKKCFFLASLREGFRGSRGYWYWMILLVLLSYVGLWAYSKQLVVGLEITNMTDQVSWGLYIANFTFLVGVAAAAVMLVIPAYVYKNKKIHEVVVYGEMMAIAAVIMCLMFVTVDLGRPERAWHMIPVIGAFNFPTSMLAWDVVVLNGYLLLNIYICGYVLFTKFNGMKTRKAMYLPFVFLSIFWAISIHTVTAFLYVGLVGRPFWNAAIVAPRFLGSAFTAGPALLIIVFQLIRHYTNHKIKDEVITLLRQIMTVALLTNLFLLGCEAFKEFYSASAHSSSAQYLFFGLHGHGMLVPWVWTALAIELIAVIVLITPLSHKMKLLNTACVLSFLGILVEKGPCLIIPGFLPTPLGEIKEYFPSTNELLISMGIWAFGALLFTFMVKMALPIMSKNTEDSH